MRLRSLHRPMLAMVLMSYMARASVEGGQLVETWSFEFWLFLFISAFLVTFAGICSGLTVGYLSIKKQTLLLWIDSPDEQKIRIAKTILGVLENHHLLLSTLLLSNALAMQALPIFLDKLVPAYIAVLISTVSVLMVGEVIPQAYCTGSKQIPIAYYMSGFVKVLQFLFYVFVKPIAWFLDNWLGHHEDKIHLNKNNLKTLLQLHKSKELGYTPEQIELLQNTLDLRSRKVEQCMIPIDRLYMLDLDAVVNIELLEVVRGYNFSTVAVYHGDRSRILGVFRIKQLMGVEVDNKKRLRDCVKIDPVIFVHEGRNLLELFDLLKEKKNRFCFVLKDEQKGPGRHFTFSQQPQGRRPIGMINLKRIFEEIVLKEFADGDHQKQIRSGEFTDQLIVRKPTELVEGVQQD